MNAFATGIIKLFFALIVLDLCTAVCALSASPLLVACERNQMKNKDFNKSSLWAIAFCIIAVTSLAAGLILTIAVMHHPVVTGTLQNILGWMAALNG